MSENKHDHQDSKESENQYIEDIDRAGREVLADRGQTAGQAGNDAGKDDQ